jgi:3-deoxy-D-arabino-heptulosonate 7-phosphate (DAHP) synthase
LAKDVSKEFLKGAAKEAGDQTVQYEVENNPEQVEDAQQQLDDAQAQAQVRSSSSPGTPREEP